MADMLEVRNQVYNILLQMNYSPSNLVITSFEPNQADRNSLDIEGQFQNGIMGTTITFSATYETITKGLKRFRITGSNKPSVSFDSL